MMRVGSTPWLYRKRVQAAQKARHILTRPDRDRVVIWDSETTSLDFESVRFVEIAAIDLDGNVLIDQRINPQTRIPEKAQSIHGIDLLDLVGQPTFEELTPTLRAIFDDKVWVIYNAAYDWDRAMRSNLRRTQRDYALVPINPHETICAMELYAQFNGEWSHRHGSFTWQKLVNACDDFAIVVPQRAHSALGDCYRTLEVMRAMSRYLD